MLTWLLWDLPLLYCFLFIWWFVYCEAAIGAAVAGATGSLPVRPIEWWGDFIHIHWLSLPTPTLTASPRRLMQRMIITFHWNHVQKVQGITSNGVHVLLRFIAKSQSSRVHWTDCIERIKHDKKYVASIYGQCVNTIWGSKECKQQRGRSGWRDRRRRGGWIQGRRCLERESHQEWEEEIKEKEKWRNDATRRIQAA